MFTLKVSTANAAFEGDPRIEVARILRKVAERLEESGAPEAAILDANGNTVGKYTLTSR
jgi:hypothetical protein